MTPSVMKTSSLPASPQIYAEAVGHHQNGRSEQAMFLCKLLLTINPTHADAWHLSGAVAQQAGRRDRVVKLIARVVTMVPGVARFRSELGLAFSALGLAAASAVAFRASLCLEPDAAGPYYLLGNLLVDCQRFDAAAAAYGLAIRLNPKWVEAWSNIGNALYHLGKTGAALTAFESAIAIQPGLAEAWSNMANPLRDSGRFDEAVSSCVTALALKPGLARVHSNLLLNIWYQNKIGPEAILAEARRFAQQWESPLAVSVFANRRETDKRLRIGYVSGDFRRHPVGYFLAPVLEAHDTVAVESYCYANLVAADDLSAQLRQAADHWRDLSGQEDSRAAEIIAADGIDILIDLAGHTAKNRLPLFARRAAPVQISWLGYWGTTGLSAMDYILSDETTIPQGDDDFYSEKVVRLPGCRFCYQPPDYAPDPAPLPPAALGRPVTFGSFSNPAKLGPTVLDLWAAVLRAVPGSRLLLKWSSLEEGPTRERLIDAFASLGINPKRLILRRASPHRDMLAEYADMDIALDPTPFSGGLTTCEALWMGVPVVTLAGAAAPSRQTLGFLQSLELTEWATESTADYVRIASDLAADLQGLERLRRELRPRMAGSSLCDGPKFTRRLEAVLRSLWQVWCSSA